MKALPLTSRRSARGRVAILLAGAAVVAVIIVILTVVRDEQTDVAGRVLVDDAEGAAAMAPLDDGGLLFGERATGRVRMVDAGGNVAREPVATVDVATEGQRGLLGLAVDDAGAVFAAWTRPDLRLVVGRVAPGARRLVWIGPLTEDVANGGHIAFAPDGRLVIGIGDLRAPERVADPSAPNGKLLALDPDRGPGQSPDVVSSGWNNPFAFAFTPRGDLWVADNAPGARPERLARGDVRAPTITELDGKVAPSGLAAVTDGRILVCGFIAQTLQAYAVTRDGGAMISGEPLAADCSLGVVLLADGRVAYATEDSIRVLAR